MQATAPDAEPTPAEPVVQDEPVMTPVVQPFAEAVPEPAVEAPAVAAVAEAPPAPVVVATLEDKVPVGTLIERTAAGWKVGLMYGGAVRLFGEGATIRAAFAAAGL